MFIGHYGPSFAIKSLRPTIPLWLLFIAVQVVDVAWAVLVLLGVEKSGAHGTWLFHAGMRELSREESNRRAAAGETFALRFRVPREWEGAVRFTALFAPATARALEGAKPV